MEMKDAGGLDNCSGFVEGGRSVLCEGCTGRTSGAAWRWGTWSSNMVGEKERVRRLMFQP